MANTLENEIEIEVEFFYGRGDFSKKRSMQINNSKKVMETEQNMIFSFLGFLQIFFIIFRNFPKQFCYVSIIDHFYSVLSVFW